MYTAAYLSCAHWLCVGGVVCVCVCMYVCVSVSVYLRIMMCPGHVSTIYTHVLHLYTTVRFVHMSCICTQVYNLYTQQYFLCRTVSNLMQEEDTPELSTSMAMSTAMSASNGAASSDGGQHLPGPSGGMSGSSSSSSCLGGAR